VFPHVSPLLLATPAASGPTASPHRYWRVVFGSNSDGNLESAGVVAFAEMEMRETTGGADVTGSGTASASSSFTGFSAAGAFANDGTTTEWASSGAVAAGHQWIKYDFGAGVTKAIVEIGIQPRVAAFYTQGPGQFKIQSSDDDSTWADEWWVVYPGGSNGHGYVDGSFKSFTKPVVDQSPSANRHLYWRISITGSNGGSFVGARNIEMRVVSGSIDETEGGTATSRSNFSGLPPSQAFDGCFGDAAQTEWASNNVGFPEWIQYQFPRAVEITELKYQCRGIGNGQAPSGFDFQYSDNGSSWTTAKSVSSLTWTGAEIKTWTVP